MTHGKMAAFFLGTFINRCARNEVQRQVARAHLRSAMMRVVGASRGPSRRRMAREAMAEVIAAYSALEGKTE